MIDLRDEQPEWASFHRLINDLIAGVARRHTFSPWELDFLLDLENSRLRKSGREVALRKYLRAVYQSQADGAAEPPRLCTFLAAEFPVRSAANGAG